MNSPNAFGTDWLPFPASEVTQARDHNRVVRYGGGVDLTKSGLGSGKRRTDGRRRLAKLSCLSRRLAGKFAASRPYQDRIAEDLEREGSGSSTAFRSGALWRPGMIIKKVDRGVEP